METQEQLDDSKRLLFTLLEILSQDKHPPVENLIFSFRELFDRIEPGTSFPLLRLKLKNLVKVRDQLLFKEAHSPPSSALHAPVRELLDRALGLLEGATESSGTFSSNLNEAIEQLRIAKNIVDVKALSQNLIATGAEMMAASSLFQNNLGKIANAMFDYQQKIQELENEVEKHKTLAMKDQLTGIYNRGAFDRRFETTYSHAQRFGMPLSLFLIDIDHFKTINDSYGHQVGDNLLVSFSKLLQSSLKDFDTLYRFGGDEFAVLLPNIDLKEAETYSQKVHQYIQNNVYTSGDIKLNISISGGLASLCPSDTPQSFFKRADDLLYQAKKLGRNQTCCN